MLAAAATFIVIHYFRIPHNTLCLPPLAILLGTLKINLRAVSLPRTKVLKNTFTYSGAVLWNSLFTTHLRQAGSLAPFHAGCSGHLYCNSLFSNSPKYTLFAPQILHKLLFSNALGDTAYSQEHLKTMVYAKFGGQTKCIMGNSKIENSVIVKHGSRVKQFTLFIVVLDSL